MPAFQIIYGPKETPKDQWTIYEHLGAYDHITERRTRIREWDNPQEPSELVKKFNQSSKLYHYGTAYMVQRLADAVDYLAREAAREDYLPFEVQGKAFHCAELKNGEISYYNTRFDAYDDKRSTMKVGRYYRQFTDKNDNEIAEICARLGVENNDVAFKLARTREEIKHVYENGPGSCMKDPQTPYCVTEKAYVHPCEAYASPDLAVAYLVRDERITSRTLVNMKDKEWVCIYGDSVRMRSYLEAEGFTEGGVTGCRLLKIDCGDRWACPYLDDDVTVYDDGKDDEYMVFSKESGAWASEEAYVLKDAASSRYQTDGWEESYDDSYDY